jgi:tyrosinase
MTLEGLHADVHAWVGGTMRDLLTSPADPLFWLHHANIDRIYTSWRKQHADNSRYHSHTFRIGSKHGSLGRYRAGV